MMKPIFWSYSCFQVFGLKMTWLQAISYFFSHLRLHADKTLYAYTPDHTTTTEIPDSCMGGRSMRSVLAGSNCIKKSFLIVVFIWCVPNNSESIKQRFVSSYVVYLKCIHHLSFMLFTWIVLKTWILHYAVRFDSFIIKISLQIDLQPWIHYDCGYNWYNSIKMET